MRDRHCSSAARFTGSTTSETSVRVTRRLGGAGCTSSSGRCKCAGSSLPIPSSFASPHPLRTLPLALVPLPAPVIALRDATATRTMWCCRSPAAYARLVCTTCRGGREPTCIAQARPRRGPRAAETGKEARRWERTCWGLNHLCVACFVCLHDLCDWPCCAQACRSSVCVKGALVDGGGDSRVASHKDRVRPEKPKQQ